MNVHKGFVTTETICLEVEEYAYTDYDYYGDYSDIEGEYYEDIQPTGRSPYDRFDVPYWNEVFVYTVFVLGKLTRPLLLQQQTYCFSLLLQKCTTHITINKIIVVDTVIMNKVVYYLYL